MRSHFLVILAAVFLGGTGVAVKMVGSGVHPMSLAFYRVFFAFLFMLAVVPFLDRKTFRVKKKDLKDYFIVGAVMAVSFSLYVMANIMTTVQNAVLLSYVHPFFVLFIAYFLLKERVTKTKMVTLAMAITGIAIISPFSAMANVTGDFVAIISAGTHALLIVLMRREDRDHSIGDVFWFFLFASVLLSPLPFIYGFGDLVS
ncbi:MAG: DMT family transporter, partial [Candidatus Aenigmatarchaeota archaeon]